jgi:hypothetical protein
VIGKLARYSDIDALQQLDSQLTVELGSARTAPAAMGRYAAYYNESRIHRSLDKDAPFHRAIERFGVITSQPVLGGLHHQYCRI